MRDRASFPSARRGPEFRLVVLVLLVSLHAACQEPDPWQRLATAREAYELKLPFDWVEAPALEDGRPRQALLSVLIIDRSPRLKLPCLTIDVVFVEGEDERSRELARHVHELDLTGINEAGGALEVVVRAPMPPGEITGVGVTLHDVPLEQLATLCEAEAVRPAEP
ncbi:MAG: hypothetical protein JSV80_11035 [Acidobacteriota bacterium]|nr:MAG: hypothetical protein JSV80_11035 [Acidobacteriota bacterium]